MSGAHKAHGLQGDIADILADIHQKATRGKWPGDGNEYPHNVLHFKLQN